jgi:hypothetical protein
VKEKQILFSTPMVRAILEGRKTQTRRLIKSTDKWVRDFDLPKSKYQPGDILWVRETFCEVPYEYNHIPIKGGHITTPKYAYKADSKRDYTGIWKPSIHMPKAAARIWLEVTDVRVERLQEITEEAARAEGITRVEDGKWESEFRLGWFDGPIKAFRALWDSLNAKRGYPWESNPWVWVIDFRRVQHGTTTP